MSDFEKLLTAYGAIMQSCRPDSGIHPNAVAARAAIIAHVAELERELLELMDSRNKIGICSHCRETWHYSDERTLQEGINSHLEKCQKHPARQLAAANVEIEQTRAALQWPEMPMWSTMTLPEIAKHQIDSYRLFLSDTSADMECLPKCDSHFHEKLCPVTNTAEAWRQLRTEIERLKAEIAELWETIRRSKATDDAPF